MASLNRVTTVQVWTNPTELRKLADKFERLRSTRTVGDSCTVEEWLDGEALDEVRVSFVDNRE